jgi:transglutaminase superfamily protein
MTTDEGLYYSSHSVRSDPGNRRELLDALPKDPAELPNAVSGLILDTAFVAPLGIVGPPESADDLESRGIPAMLARILARDAGSLAAARAPEKRLIGVCCHFALLACSALRHHGVPARVRVGFANYFEPGFHDDHWITEYWDGTRWRLMDPELTPQVCRHFGVPFDPCDVPRDRFVTAGLAWLGVRSGRIDQATCGVLRAGITGEWFVAGSVVRDLAALNKREMLPWDYWGIARGLRPGIPLTEATAARIDVLAEMMADPDADWKTLRETYDRDEALRVPSVVLSFPKGVPTEVVVPTQ